MSFWAVAAPLLGVVIGGALTGGSTLFAESRRDKRARAERLELRTEHRDDQRWQAEVDGLRAAQEALTSMISTAIAIKDLGRHEERDAKARDATKTLTLAVANVFDDEARTACEGAANSLVKYTQASSESRRTAVLDAATADSERALVLLGARLRLLYGQEAV